MTKAAIQTQFWNDRPLPSWNLSQKSCFLPPLHCSTAVQKSVRERANSILLQLRRRPKGRPRTSVLDPELRTGALRISLLSRDRFGSDWAPATHPRRMGGILCPRRFRRMFRVIPGLSALGDLLLLKISVSTALD